MADLICKSSLKTVDLNSNFEMEHFQVDFEISTEEPAIEFENS